MLSSTTVGIAATAPTVSNESVTGVAFQSDTPGVLGGADDAVQFAGCASPRASQ